MRRSVLLVLSIVGTLSAGCQRSTTLDAIEVRGEPASHASLAPSPGASASEASPDPAPQAPPAAPVAVVDAQFLEEIGRRATKILARPDVTRSFDALIESVFSDPSVAGSAGGLLASIEADKTLVANLQKLMSDLQTHPAMQRFVQRIVRERMAGKKLEEIEAVVGGEAERKFSGPVIDGALTTAVDGFMARPDVAVPLHRLDAIVASSEKLTAPIRTSFNAHKDRFSGRLVALNGGVMPDDRKATALLLDHFFSDDRIARLYKDLTALPVMRRELAAAARDIAGVPAFQRIATDAARACIVDETFRKRAIDAIAAVLPDPVDAKKLAAALKLLLDTPVVPRTIVATFDKMMADPALGAIGSRALGRIAADREFQASITRFFDTW